MKYFLEKDGKQIEAIAERWGWGVVYKDGTELKQFADDGVFHQFAEINQDEVEMFVMIKLDDSGKRIDMKVESKQIFHFYRNIILAGGSPDERRVRIFAFGYKDKETGATAYHWILPDDRIVISDKDIDLTKFNV